MKTPREILWQRHQSVEPKLDAVRQKGFPAVFGGIISASGLENSLRSGAWSLDIFRPRAVVTDEASD